MKNQMPKPQEYTDSFILTWKLFLDGEVFKVCQIQSKESEVKRFIYFNRYKIVNIVKTCRVLMQISDRVCVMRVLKQAGRTERIL